MSVTATVRDIQKLTVTAQTALKLLAQECIKAGINNIFVTETFRSKERQKYLYTQGRTRSGNIVTWTLTSIHSSGKAWDLAVSNSSDLYDTAVLNKVGAIAGRLGIEWGGSWIKTPDKPHFQIDSNWKIPKGYAIEGDIVIPTGSKELIKFTPHKKATETKIKSPSIKSLPFSSKTLQEKTLNSLDSKGKRKIIVERAIEKGASVTWMDKFEQNTATETDYVGLAVLTALDGF